MKTKVLVIVGPTASGKSSLAVELAKELNGEVISADSRQVYKGLDIGTGKITPKEMKKISHHMIDVVSAKKVYTASDYLHAARPIIEDIASRGRFPIVCGGTGFFIDALVGRIVLPEVDINPQLRERLERMSNEKLFEKLLSMDPRRAKSIDRHNSRRLVRAIEIASAIGESPLRQSLPIYDVQWIGILPSLDVIQKKIHIRLLSRMKGGMVAEAKRLHAKGLPWKRMEQLGLEYRYLALYLQGVLSKSDMMEELELRIFQYAKRQITYWNRNTEIKWFSTPREAKKSISDSAH